MNKNLSQVWDLLLKIEVRDLTKHFCKNRNNGKLRKRNSGLRKNI